MTFLHQVEVVVLLCQLTSLVKEDLEARRAVSETHGGIQILSVVMKTTIFRSVRLQLTKLSGVVLQTVTDTNFDSNT